MLTADIHRCHGSGDQAFGQVFHFPQKKFRQMRIELESRYLFALLQHCPSAHITPSPLTPTMDLKVHLPTFSIEQYEALSLLDFLLRLEASANRQNAFFDESITGYVVLTNQDCLSELEQQLYFTTLQKSFISVGLSVHPTNNHRASDKSRHHNNNAGNGSSPYDNFQIRTFNYSYKDCIFNDVIELDQEDSESVSLDNSSAISASKETSNAKKIVQFISIWKFKLPITYPKRKVSNPEIIISILLTLTNYQKLIQSAKFSSLESSVTSASNNKIMMHDNASTDEVTLKRLYKPVSELNLLQGLEPQVKVDPMLQNYNSPNLPASKVNGTVYNGADNNAFNNQTTVTSALLTSNASETANKRSSMISTYSPNINDKNYDAIPSTINLNAKILLPVYPVLNMRLKCTKPAGRNDILLATLEIESSKELNKINMNLNLLEINIEFPNGSIKPLIPASLTRFPIQIDYNDNINFIYELINNNSTENLAKKPIMVTLISQPIPKDNPDGNSSMSENTNDWHNSNQIMTCWNTMVDFSIVAPPTNTALRLQSSKASYGGSSTTNSSTASQKQQVWQRNNPYGSSSNSNIISTVSANSPQLNSNNSHLELASRIASPALNSTSFSMGVKNDAHNSSSLGGSDAHQKLKNQTRTTSTSLTVNIPRTSKLSVLNGLILSFHGTTNVKVGQIFKWKIQAINKSHKILNLSLYIQPKDNNNHSFLTTNIGHNPTSSAPGGQNTIHANSPYNKVRGNQIIYPYTSSSPSSSHGADSEKVNLTKVFNQTKLTPTGIICLNNDVRIGPFDHYSVFETEINLIAIEKGIFSLQGVKIIDITSGESFDCGKLLEVVVFD